MPRYIDAEQLIRDLIDNRSFYPAIVKRAIENAPIADVVPRSEVEEADKEIERLTKILENYALQYGTVKDQQKIIEKAKQEVAREIFDVIYEDCFDQYGYLDYKAFEELKNKYIGGQDDNQ